MLCNDVKDTEVAPKLKKVLDTLELYKIKYEHSIDRMENDPKVIHGLLNW